jgi:two-component system NarL family response regulator
MKKIRILVIDDHPLIREGLEALLADHSHVEVVGVASDGDEGLTQLRRLRPDCVVVDLAMPNLCGVEAISLYLRELPELGIVVFTGHANEMLCDEVLKAGARAYVLKGSSVENLVSAILEVCRGRYWVSPELNASIIKQYLGQQKKKSFHSSGYETLTNREKQVFLLLANGRSPRETAESLSISTKTVSKHVVSIKNKLDVNNSAQMAIYAAKIGLGLSSMPS